MGKVEYYKMPEQGRYTELMEAASAPGASAHSLIAQGYKKREVAVAIRTKMCRKRLCCPIALYASGEVREALGLFDLRFRRAFEYLVCAHLGKKPSHPRHTSRNRMVGPATAKLGELLEVAEGKGIDAAKREGYGPTDVAFAAWLLKVKNERKLDLYQLLRERGWDAIYPAIPVHLLRRANLLFHNDIGAVIPQDPESYFLYLKGSVGDRSATRMALNALCPKQVKEGKRDRSKENKARLLRRAADRLNPPYARQGVVKIPLTKAGRGISPYALGVKLDVCSEDAPARDFPCATCKTARVEKKGWECANCFNASLGVKPDFDFQHLFNLT